MLINFLKKFNKKPTTGEKNKLNRLLSFSIFLSANFVILTPVVLFPLFYSYITSKFFNILSFSQIIFFLWLIFFIRNKTPCFPKRNILFWIVFLFCLTLVASSFFGINLKKSLGGNFERCTGLLLIIYLFLFLVASSAFFNKKDWEEFLFVSLLLGAVISLLTIFSVFGILEPKLIQAGASLGNSSFLGTYLLFIFFFSLYFAFEKDLSFKKFFILEVKEIKFIAFFAATTSIIALFYSTARAATISTLWGAVIFYLFYLAIKEKNKKLQRIGRFLLLIVLCATIYLIIDLHVQDSISQDVLNRLSTRSRSAVWKSSWPLIKERPILGYGPENFEDVFVKNFDPRLFLKEFGTETRFDKAHNVILDTLIVGGALGLFFYISIFIYSFYFLWKNFFRKKISFWVSASFSSLFIAYFLQNLTVFDTPSSYLMFFLAIGFFISIENKTGWEDYSAMTSNKINLAQKFLTTLSIFIFLLSSYFFIFKPLKTTFFATKMVTKSFSAKEWIDFYKKAEQASFFSVFQVREYCAKTIKDKFESGEASRQELEFMAIALEKTRQESIDNFYGRLSLGLIYNILGKEDHQKIDEAEKVFQETIKISPKNPYSYWYFAETKILKKEYREALNLAQKSIDLEPRIVRSHLLYLKIARLLNNQELIDQKISEIKNLFPAEEIASTSEDVDAKIEIQLGRCFLTFFSFHWRLILGTARFAV